MATIALVNTPGDNANAPLRRRSVEPAPALADRIAALAAHLHAVTYELLVLLREFDDSGEWHGGFASCAHWLHWRTGIAHGAGREKVRVAHALAALPRVSATMARGGISYAKVRAITRVATRETEGALLDFASPPQPLTSSGSCAPGVASIDRPRPHRPKRGICTASCRPGWTTTGWS